MIDIVFPEGNEKEFLEIAEKLGLKGLVFVYKNEKDFFQGKAKLKIFNGLLTEPKKFMRKPGILLFYKPSEQLIQTRTAIERGFEVVFELEQPAQKDPLHYRASGLDQVLCKLAATKGTKIGFSFSSVLNTSGARRAVVLGRMAQNIAFCRKFKVPMLLASFARHPFELRNPEDLAALFTTLGMNAGEAKRALGWR